MAIREYNGKRYESLFGSDVERLESFMELNELDSGKWVVVVVRADLPEAEFDVLVETGAPQELVDSFVRDAKPYLESRYRDWAAAFPELAEEAVAKRRAGTAEPAPRPHGRWWHRIFPKA